MALITCHVYPHISTQKSRLVIRPLTKASRLKQRHIPAKKTVLPSLTIRSSFKEKVFEDQSNGIVCYADESGEIVCEGIDEGPRYDHQPVQIIQSSNQRNIEAYDFLQQRWNDFVRGTELNPADHSGVTNNADININGFNASR